MEALEKKKLEAQLKQIDATIAALEVKIDERKEDIKRVEEHIALQRIQEDDIKLKLKS